MHGHLRRANLHYGPGHRQNSGIPGPPPPQRQHDRHVPVGQRGDGGNATKQQKQKNRAAYRPLGEVGAGTATAPMWAAVSNTPYRQYKIETFDGGLSAPFIIRYPKVLRPGTRYHAPFLLQDIAPTCLTWAKLSVPSHMDGQALNSYWSKPASIPPEKVGTAFPTPALPVPFSGSTRETAPL